MTTLSKEQIKAPIFWRYLAIAWIVILTLTIPVLGSSTEKQFMIVGPIFLWTLALLPILACVGGIIYRKNIKSRMSYGALLAGIIFSLVINHLGWPDFQGNPASLFLLIVMIITLFMMVIEPMSRYTAK